MKEDKLMEHYAIYFSIGKTIKPYLLRKAIEEALSKISESNVNVEIYRRIPKLSNVFRDMMFPIYKPVEGNKH